MIESRRKSTLIDLNFTITKTVRTLHEFNFRKNDD